MGALSSVWTIGHSNLGIDAFVRLLKAAGIEAVADVRSELGHVSRKWEPVSG